MSAEQFGIILDMAAHAGEGAFALACVYMGVGFLKALLGPAAIVAIVAMIIRCVRYAIDDESKNVERRARGEIE